MQHYDIQWDMVAIAPVLVGLFLGADYIDRIKARKKHASTPKSAKDGRRRGFGHKHKSGFRNMKSHGQRMRERARRQEEEAAATPRDGLHQPQL